MSLAELGDYGEGPMRLYLEEITVGRLLSGSVVARRIRRSRGSSAQRAEYDAAVLHYVVTRKHAVQALDVRKTVGGTADQVRRALGRLVLKGLVLTQGKA